MDLIVFQLSRATALTSDAYNATSHIVSQFGKATVLALGDYTTTILIGVQF